MPPKFFTMGEIEGLRGIKSPHEKELEDIKARGLPRLQELSKAQLEVLVSQVGATITTLYLGETWAFTKAMFPDVLIHVALRRFEDEFGTGATSELLVVFSGDTSRLVPGEDLASYIELLFEYADRLITRAPPRAGGVSVPSPMLTKALRERAPGFPLLRAVDAEPLQQFVGGKISLEGTLRFTFLPFPGIAIDVTWTPTQDVQFTFSGDQSYHISLFDLERVTILSINHVLRYVLITYGLRACPTICHQMFTPFGRQKYSISPQ